MSAIDLTASENELMSNPLLAKDLSETGISVDVPKINNYHHNGL